MEWWSGGVVEWWSAINATLVLWSIPSGSHFGHSSFGFVSDFGFRASDFATEGDAWMWRRCLLHFHASLQLGSTSNRSPGLLLPSLCIVRAKKSGLVSGWR